MKRRVYVPDSNNKQIPGGSLARFIASCQGMTERDRRNARTTNYWLFAWMVVFVGTSFGIKGGQLETGPLAWIAITASTVIGLVVVHYYMRFLREADELLRKIQMEALAIGFGAAFIGTFTMSLMERLRGQAFDIGDLFLLMVIFYMIGIFTGMRRYA
jgi:hypothetical protein